MKLYKRVERYAEHQNEWLEDFFEAFDKMQQNVDEPWKLVTGPNSFWNISKDMSCCLELSLMWEKHDSDVYVAPSENIKDAFECQEFCKNPSEKYKKRLGGKPCKLFTFGDKCVLKPQWTSIKIDSSFTSIIGKPKCSKMEGEDYCQILQKEWYHDLLEDLS